MAGVGSSPGFMTSPATGEFYSTKHEFPPMEWVLHSTRQLLVISKIATATIAPLGVSCYGEWFIGFTLDDVINCFYLLPVFTASLKASPQGEGKLLGQI